ncbi:IS1 family transposase [Pleurocapsa sp. PCC 7319]|uniref:IS1 family transposase n=1 Tax=Pleurocapsa sp. PCC 7319 TaxID=118161 RepID=UPI001181AA88|nr:IS1 family transposase [Pleurocapsa sp. PCC 7319]
MNCKRTSEMFPERKLWKSQRLLSVQKKQVWLWTVVNSHQAGVLKWVARDRSQSTSVLWGVVRSWQCFLYITDGWKVYPCFMALVNEGMIFSKCDR